LFVRRSHLVFKSGREYGARRLCDALAATDAVVSDAATVQVAFFVALRYCSRSVARTRRFAPKRWPGRQPRDSAADMLY